MKKSSYLIQVLLLTTIVLSGCSKKADENADATVKEQSATEHSDNKNANDGSAESQIIRPVQSYVVTARTIQSNHVFNGLVKPSKESKLSFRVSGNIKNLYVKIGDYVKAGQNIARLDSTDYNVNTSQTLANLNNVKANKDVVRANIRQAEAEMIRAKAAYSRAEKLYETNTIPVSEFEQARAAWLASSANYEGVKLRLSSADAQIAAAQQQVKASRNQLVYTRLNAPFSGYISQVLVEENEQIGAGQPVVLLSNKQKTEVEVGLPASVIASVKVGESVRVSFADINNQEYLGVVSKVAVSTVNSSVYPVTIKLQNAGNDILPGMTANVVFAGTQNAEARLEVPATAVGEDRDGKFVYLLEKQPANKDKQLYMVKRQPITIGQMSSSGFVVNGGVSKNQLIAKSGLNMLQAGDLVTLYQH